MSFDHHHDQASDLSPRDPPPSPDSYYKIARCLMATKDRYQESPEGRGSSKGLGWHLPVAKELHSCITSSGGPRRRPDQIFQISQALNELDGHGWSRQSLYFLLEVVGKFDQDDLALKLPYTTYKALLRCPEEHRKFYLHASATLGASTRDVVSWVSTDAHSRSGGRIDRLPRPVNPRTRADEKALARAIATCSRNLASCPGVVVNKERPREADLLVHRTDGDQIVFIRIVLREAHSAPGEDDLVRSMAKCTIPTEGEKSGVLVWCCRGRWAVKALDEKGRDTLYPAWLPPVSGLIRGLK